MGGTGPGVAGSGAASLDGEKDLGLEVEGAQGRGVGCGVCHGCLRSFFSLVWKWFPIDMQKALPALLLLIKMENTDLCDAFNHFGIVKSSGLWGMGWPWCAHKLA